MESIFHEKQEGALCAQHCLNSLLQGSYFTPVDLAAIAHDLDEAERLRMAEGNVTSQDYLNFMQEPSSNMDDSGYFSIQVICKALEVWNLDLLPYNSPAAGQIRKNPTQQNAYICNQQNHWLTIRKLGSQWFNLNSIKAHPELISDTYLSLLLAQLQAEGYSIFVVVGAIPQSESQIQFQQNPISQEDYKKYVESERAKSLAKSSQNKPSTEKPPDAESYVVADESTVRNKRLQYFDKLNGNKETIVINDDDVINEGPTNNDLSEEDMLEMAIQMSMQPL